MDAGIGVGWSTLDRGRGQLAALVEACVRLSLRLSAPPPALPASPVRPPRPSTPQTGQASTALGAFRPKVSLVRRALRQPAYGAIIAQVAIALFTLVQ